MKYSWGKYVSMKRKQANHDYKEVFRREVEKAISNGQPYDIPKMKRFRSAFTTEQVNYLEKEFKKYPYVGNSRRKDVSNILDIPERAVKIWFQNRRMKEKKDVTNKDPDAVERNTKTETANSQLINVSHTTSINYPPSLPIITATEESQEEPNVDKNLVFNDAQSEVISNIPVSSTYYKEASPCPDLVTICKESSFPSSSPTVITKNSTSSKSTPEFSIDLLKKCKQGSGNENTRDGHIKSENDAAESSQDGRHVNQAFPKVDHQTPEYVPIVPACAPQDLSSRKPNVSQFQQRMCSKGLPIPTQQMMQGIDVNNADIPLYLKGYYTQSYIPPGNMIWKPLNVTPVMSTEVPRVISNNSAPIPTLLQQNMPRRNCTCDCHLKHFPSPLVFQQNAPPSPQVQYVLTAVPFHSNNSGLKFV